MGDFYRNVANNIFLLVFYEITNLRAKMQWQLTFP